MKKEQERRKIIRSKTKNLRPLDNLHPVLIANEQTILPKKAEPVPKPLLDPNGSNKTIRRTVGMKDKQRILNHSGPVSILKNPLN